MTTPPRTNSVLKATAIADTFSVRQVTNAQASWRAQAGRTGDFALQLILDHGVTEQVLPIEAGDLKVVLDLLRGSRRTTFDADRGLLVVPDICPD